MGVYESVLYAPDLGQAERFYSALLGREPISMDHDRGMAYRISDASMLLVFNPLRTVEPSDLVPSHGATGEGHLALSITPGSIEAWRERLSRLGIEVEREVPWPSGAYSVYFRDPAGNSLEIVDGQIWAGASPPADATGESRLT